MAAKRRRRKYVYVQHDTAQVHQAIRAAVFEGGILWDYFSVITQDRVYGANEFERGVAEGMRALADQILTIAMTRQEMKVAVNQED